jgi:acetyl-CoA synthetase
MRARPAELAAGMAAVEPPKLSAYTRFADAQANATSHALWKLFDGSPQCFNIANECVVRHADGSGRAAVRIAHANGGDEVLSFDEVAAGAAQFAHWLAASDVAAGDRIAFMLEPSKAFYISLFGSMLHGAVSVPLFTLFGLDGLKLRVEDCRPKLIITNAEKAEIARAVPGLRVVVADEALLGEIARFPTAYRSTTRAGHLACFQYTSGTRRWSRSCTPPSTGQEFAPAINSSAPPRRLGATACGTARWRLWRSASPPAPSPAASIPCG